MSNTADAWHRAVKTIAILWVYNTTQCLQLMGEYLLRYSNKIEPADLRQCPYDH